MSLMRLLTAGRSLVGLKESENRYRVTSQRLLPKFEPKKNPFGRKRGTAEPEQKPAEPAVETPKPEPQVERPAGASAQNISGAPQAPQKAGRWIGRIWLLCSRWLSRLAFWRRPAGSAAVGRRVPNRMFQAELSLDSVRVVRNDLSDSDLEVVTARTTRPAKREDGAASGEKAPAATPRWGKVTGRLFGAARH